MADRTTYFILVLYIILVPWYVLHPCTTMTYTMLINYFQFQSSCRRYTTKIAVIHLKHTHLTSESESLTEQGEPQFQAYLEVNEIL